MSVQASKALRALERELSSVPMRADGNLNALDFIQALKQAAEDVEQTEYEDYMGEDL